MIDNLNNYSIISRIQSQTFALHFYQSLIKSLIYLQTMKTMKLSFLVKRISVSMLSTEPIANCTSVQKVKRSITRYRASLPPLHQYRQALLLVPPLDLLKHPAKNITKTKKRLKLPLTTTMPRKRSE